MSSSEYAAYQLRQGTLPVVKPSDCEVERELHETFEQWCRMRGDVHWSHNRMDKKSTARPGQFDFELQANGRGCCVEFKTATGSVTPEQQEMICEMDRAKTPWLVTTDAGEAIQWAKEKLGL